MDDVRKNIEEHLPALQRYAMSLACHPSAAQDLVQECTLRAISKSRMFKQGTNLRAWLFTILHNLHVSDVRQRAKRPEVKNPDEVLERMAVQPTQLSSSMLREVGEAMSLLPQAQQRILMSIGVAGKTYEEASSEFHIPVGTVKSRYARARRALQERLQAAPSATAA